MRSKFFFSLLILSSLVIGLACEVGGPITLDPSAPEAAQLPLALDLVARYEASSGLVWIGAPPGTSKSGREVYITVPDELIRRVKALDDGSFLYRFPGDENSTALVEWTDPTGDRHSKNLAVTAPGEGSALNIAAAGLYSNRLTVMNDVAWVVNSGNDELTAYDLTTLQETGMRVTVPEWSNPWEAAFISPTEGILTTLFSGVFQFDAVEGTIIAVDTTGFSNFASPNGCAIIGDYAWIANPNPITYFPTVLGTGWVNKVALGTDPGVIAEIETDWLNPQNVIVHGDYVYVSCTGTVDFFPPDYLATALDPGGVHVIDPDTGEIVESYELGTCGPGPMAISPDGRYLYAGSNVAGHVYRIDLLNGQILNDASSPIVVSDYTGTFIPTLCMTDGGLLICPSFNTDTIHFVDSRTGEQNPFPVFEPIELHPDDPDALWGIQDIAVCERNGETGLLVLTTVLSAFHWTPM